jgi:hypothetical protein
MRNEHREELDTGEDLVITAGAWVKVARIKNSCGLLKALRSHTI